MFDPFDMYDLSLIRQSSGMELVTLAPWVIAMRMPALALELATPWYASGGKRGREGERAVVEKTAAVIESYGAAQAEIFTAWSAILTNAMLGKAPDAFSISNSFQDISNAGLEPMARRVRANYKRLLKKR